MDQSKHVSDENAPTSLNIAHHVCTPVDFVRPNVDYKNLLSCTNTRLNYYKHHTQNSQMATMFTHIEPVIKLRVQLY